MDDLIEASTSSVIVSYTVKGLVSDSDSKSRGSWLERETSKFVP